MGILTPPSQGTLLHYPSIYIYIYILVQIWNTYILDLYDKHIEYAQGMSEQDAVTVTRHVYEYDLAKAFMTTVHKRCHHICKAAITWCILTHEWQLPRQDEEVMTTTPSRRGYRWQTSACWGRLRQAGWVLQEEPYWLRHAHQTNC
jgi:hypothetical protein